MPKWSSKSVLYWQFPQWCTYSSCPRCWFLYWNPHTCVSPVSPCLESCTSWCPKQQQTRGSFWTERSAQNPVCCKICFCPHSQICPSAGCLRTPVWTDPGGRSRGKRLLASRRRAALGSGRSRLGWEGLRQTGETPDPSGWSLKVNEEPKNKLV